MDLKWRFLIWAVRRAAPESLILDPDFGQKSPTLRGPFFTVGDCVFQHGEVPTMVWIDTALSARDGDLVLWHLPRQREGEQFATKWLIRAHDGSEWLACKYFAVHRRKGFHVAAGRVVAQVRAPVGVPNRTDPDLSARLAAEMRALRTGAPPARPDLVRFAQDLTDHNAIRAAIARHVAAWREGPQSSDVRNWFRAYDALRCRARGFGRISAAMQAGADVVRRRRTHRA